MARLPLADVHRLLIATRALETPPEAGEMMGFRGPVWFTDPGSGAVVRLHLGSGRWANVPLDRNSEVGVSDDGLRLSFSDAHGGTLEVSMRDGRTVAENIEERRLLEV